MVKEKKYNLSPENIAKNYANVIKRGIRKYAKKYLNYHDSFIEEDMFQNVMLKIVNRALDNFRGEVSLEYFLVHSIAKNIVIDMAKKENKNKNKLIDRVARIDNDDSSGQATEIIDNMADTTADHAQTIADSIAIRDIIEREILKMPEKRQKIYKLITEEGKTQKEISKIMDITQSTISEHWAKIRQQLKAALETEIPEIKEQIGK